MLVRAFAGPSPQTTTDSAPRACKTPCFERSVEEIVVIISLHCGRQTMPLSAMLARGSTVRRIAKNHR